MKDFTGNIKTLGRIFLFMYGMTAVLLFLLAAFAQRMQLDEGKLSIGIGMIYVISCFLGGFLAGKILKTKKFLWGLLLGSIYVLLIAVISLIAGEGMNSSPAGAAWNILLCILGGTLGGMIA